MTDEGLDPRLLEADGLYVTLSQEDESVRKNMESA